MPEVLSADAVLRVLRQAAWANVVEPADAAGNVRLIPAAMKVDADATVVVRALGQTHRFPRAATRYTPGRFSGGACSFWLIAGPDDEAQAIEVLVVAGGRPVLDIPEFEPTEWVTSTGSVIGVGDQVDGGWSIVRWSPGQSLSRIGVAASKDRAHIASLAAASNWLRCDVLSDPVALLRGLVDDLLSKDQALVAEARARAVAIQIHLARAADATAG